MISQKAYIDKGDSLVIYVISHHYEMLIDAVVMYQQCTEGRAETVEEGKGRDERERYGVMDGNEGGEKKGWEGREGGTERNRKGEELRGTSLIMHPSFSFPFFLSSPSSPVPPLLSSPSPISLSPTFLLSLLPFSPSFPSSLPPLPFTLFLPPLLQ